jgi:quercetin dioxygenase-like cupin family protein
MRSFAVNLQASRREGDERMNVTRFPQAPQYFPPNHFMMRCLRLQGHEAGPATDLWMGVSVIEPGGYTSSDASPVEKHYVVLEGAVTVVTADGEAILDRHDSCRLAPGESRKLENRTENTAIILLAMPFVKR